jgi:hypothetical protein
LVGHVLSPPSFRQRNNAGSHHHNNDDGGKRFHRNQGLVPVIPKLKHALASRKRLERDDFSSNRHPALSFV